MSIRSRDGRAVPESTCPNDEEPSELEVAVESTASMLRARSLFPFSVGDENERDISEEYEQWATHLLVRSPAPGSVGPRTSIARDWRGMVAFVSSRARKEQAWARESVGGLRDAMFVLIASLGKSAISQGKRDAVMQQRLAALTLAIESGSIEALKKEARLATLAITTVIDEQRTDAEAQAKLLRDQLASVGQELEETRREGETDPLTRLANRRVFDTSIGRGLSLAGAMKRPLSLLMIDIDHFKKVNDTHGHPNGDRALKAVADALIRAFPRRTDLVVRYGGEEFAVLCDSGLVAVARLAARLLDAVRALRIPIEQNVISLTISAGIAEAKPGETGEELLRRADAALYDAKRGGRDRYVIAR